MYVCRQDLYIFLVTCTSNEKLQHLNYSSLIHILNMKKVDKCALYLDNTDITLYNSIVMRVLFTNESFLRSLTLKYNTVSRNSILFTEPKGHYLLYFYIEWTPFFLSASRYISFCNSIVLCILDNTNITFLWLLWQYCLHVNHFREV